MTAVGVSSFLNLVINAAFVLKRRRFITTWYTYYTILATAARPPLGLKTSSKNKPSNKFYLCLLHIFLLVFFLPFVVFPFLLFSMPRFFNLSSFFFLPLSIFLPLL